MFGKYFDCGTERAVVRKHVGNVEVDSDSQCCRYVELEWNVSSLIKEQVCGKGTDPESLFDNIGLGGSAGCNELFRSGKEHFYLVTDSGIREDVLGWTDWVVELGKFDVPFLDLLSSSDDDVDKIVDGSHLGLWKANVRGCGLYKDGSSR
jgi:hypothetical protein